MKLYNTLSHNKDELPPPQDQKTITLYTCGPTVYDETHIGHMRKFTMDNILKRSLTYLGYDVKHVMNITDVGHLTSDADTGEDKMEKKAFRERKNVWDIAKEYEDKFWNTMNVLNIKRPEKVMKATDHIPEMIKLIKKIKKYTYEDDKKHPDGIYFDTSKFEDYGKLQGNSFNDLQQTLKAGARVNMIKGKKNITDFALWKFSSSPYTESNRQMEWWFDGPFQGQLFNKKEQWEKLNQMVEEKRFTTDQRYWYRRSIGFPGWHIECSAMSMKGLGTETIDIHTGGIDHIPVHHENEIAQSEAATGKQFVKWWVHHAFLMVDGEKMSKSKGNFYTLKDLLKRNINPLVLRYLFLQTHYRKPMNFTWEAVEGATQAYNQLKQIYHLLKEKSQGKKSLTIDALSGGAVYMLNTFKKDISDDLNIARLIGNIWYMLKEKKLKPQEQLFLLDHINTVLGLDLQTASAQDDIPNDIDKLAQERLKARKNDDFKTADELRNKIGKHGYHIEDTSDGYVIKKK